MNRRDVAGLLGFGTFCGGAGTILSYMTGWEFPRHLGGLTEMAVPTAIAFLMAGLAIMVMAKEDR